MEREKRKEERAKGTITNDTGGSAAPRLSYSAVYGGFASFKMVCVFTYVIKHLNNTMASFSSRVICFIFK